MAILDAFMLKPTNDELNSTKASETKLDTSQINMLHGAGGTVMHELVKNHIVKRLARPGYGQVSLEAMDDAAVIDDIALKSDSHAVKPIFFPGGDIGRLSVSGTVNDLAAVGSEPFALACGFLLEEGLPLTDFDRIVQSMKKTCKQAEVSVVTGDTKVVEKGSLGGCVVNMSGIGRRSEALEENLRTLKKFRNTCSERWIIDSNLHSGDKIVLTGTIGDHGLAVLSAQQGLGFGSKIKSDVQPLNKLVLKIMSEVGGIVVMKDPTRGGLADALNEISHKSKVGMIIEEEKVPIRRDVVSACEMLGLDPLEIGNEGKMIIGIIKEKAEDLLYTLRDTPEGKHAEIIGEATGDFKGVAMQTSVGGKRIIARPIGDPVPRIC